MNEIEADYRDQLRHFKQVHGREPTDEELILAHHSRYNKHQLDFMEELEEKYQECMQNPDMEDSDGGDAEDAEDSSESISVKGEKMSSEKDKESEVDAGDPLPDLTFDFDLATPPASSQPQPLSQSQSDAASPLRDQQTDDNPLSPVEEER